MSVNECPAPTTFTVWPTPAAVLTSCDSSRSVDGCSTAAGEHCWMPAQLVHVVMLSERSGGARRRLGRWPYHDAMKVHVDPDRCEGHGRCYATAAELFEADDIGNGHEVGDGTVPVGLDEKARL